MFTQITFKSIFMLDVFYVDRTRPFTRLTDVPGLDQTRNPFITRMRYQEMFPLAALWFLFLLTTSFLSVKSLPLVFAGCQYRGGSFNFTETLCAEILVTFICLGEHNLNTYCLFAHSIGRQKYYLHTVAK